MLALDTASSISVHLTSDFTEAKQLVRVLSANVRFTSIEHVVSASDLMEVISDALDFPDYFGHNWDALEECLNDLDWMPEGGVVLVLAGSRNPIHRAPHVIERLNAIWLDAAQQWQERGRAFHLLFCISSIPTDHRTIEVS